MQQTSGGAAHGMADVPTYDEARRKCCADPLPQSSV